MRVHRRLKVSDYIFENRSRSNWGSGPLPLKYSNLLNSDSKFTENRPRTTVILRKPPPTPETFSGSAHVIKYSNKTRVV